MAKELLMGNEAIGLGAIHAGVSLVSGYPGTPSTEILETVARHNDDGRIHIEWSVMRRQPWKWLRAAPMQGQEPW